MFHLNRGYYCFVKFTNTDYFVCQKQRFLYCVGPVLRYVWNVQTQATLCTCAIWSAQLHVLTRLYIGEPYLLDNKIRINSVDPDEVAHYEPPHLDLHYLQIQLFYIFGILSVLKITYIQRELLPYSY